jgi:ABC-type antimicrobial peptide transport system permease subunit
LQFLVEAVVRAVTGGLIGILLGVGSLEIIRKWASGRP